MKYGLEPIVDNNSRILILGSLPGELSIKNNKYYDNSYNHFWKIISYVFENEYIKFDDYNDKVNFLKKHNIALWDVIKCANRNGSLDNNIFNEEYNDIFNLINKYSIKYIYVNGKKAKKSLKRYMKINNVKFDYKYLTSSSAANTRYTLDEKKKIWKNIINF